MKRKKINNTFISSVALLTLSAISVKVIGLIFKIPMFGYLGSEGMGYFNTAYEIYAFFTVIATSGLPLAMSLIISGYHANGEVGRIRAVYRKSLIIFGAVGAAGSLAMTCLSELQSELIRSIGAKYSIFAIGISVLPIFISSAIRGYYQGLGNMMPTAVSQVIEALGKLVFGLLFASYAVKKGYSPEISAGMAIFGVTVGSILSLFYLLFLKVNDKSFTSEPLMSEKGEGARLIKTALPITAASSVLTMTRLIDMSMILRRLQDIGMTERIANSLYGAYTTLAVPIFALIPTLTSSVGVSLIPSLSEHIERSRREAEIKVIDTALKLTTYIAVPASIGIAVFSREIITLIFSDTKDVNIGAPLLSLLGLSVLNSCLMTTTNSVLQAYRKTALPIISMTAGAAVKLIASYFLIGNSRINIIGAPIGTFFCDAAVVIINIAFILKTVPEYKVKAKHILIPLLSIAASVPIPLTVMNCLYSKGISGKALSLSMIMLTALFYLLISVKLGALSEDEIQLIPGGKTINKILINKRNKNIKAKGEENADKRKEKVFDKS